MSWDGTERRGTETNQYLAMQEQLNRQDDVLLELRDSLREHLVESKDIGPALRELVTLWKASKLLGAIFTALAAGAAGVWSLFTWAREHLK